MTGREGAGGTRNDVVAAALRWEAVVNRRAGGTGDRDKNMLAVEDALADAVQAFRSRPTPSDGAGGLREALRERIGYTDEDHGLEHWHHASGGRTEPTGRDGVFVDRQAVLDAIDAVLA